MFKYSMAFGHFPRRTVLLLALALVAAAPPCRAQWQRVESENPPFSLEIPEGWQFRQVESRGARILPPDNAPVVEVVAWNALRPPATPDKAAVEHEAVLGRAVDYRRDGVEQIETDDGAPGLVVTGRVRSRGITGSSIFCAYAHGATHYVLGTFASEQALPDFRARVLDRMMRSFRAEAGAAPVTRPPRPLPEPEPVEPEADFEPDVPQQPGPVEPQPEEPGPPVVAEPETETAPAGVGIGGQTEPVGPEVREPSTPWIEHLSPTGFSVSIPIDWEVETGDGLITLQPAVESAGTGAVLIWPVTGSDPGAEAALRMALTRVPDLRLLRVASVEEIPDATLIDARVTGGRRLTATWAHDGAFGLLLAATAPQEAWRRELPGLARMAASFRPGDWQVAYRPEIDVAGDMGLLHWKLPPGWQVRGGVREDNGELSIDVEALGPSEDALRVGWQQPMQPRFRALTPLLESLGWREGERYSVPEGGGGLMIYRRREPEQLVRDMLLARHPRELRLTAIEATPPDGAVADLLTQADATGQVVTVKGDSAIGPRERLYLAATARAEPPLSTTCWDAASLRADAPEGRLRTSVATLITMVRTARVAERANADQAARLQDLIERARRALTAIPAELRPGTETGLTGVLDGDTPATGATAWAMPEAAKEHWSTLAGTEGTVDILGAPVETRPGG